MNDERSRMSGDARTEVAVVGGGPAAVAVASTLHRAGIDVVVVSGTGAVRRPSVGQSAPPGTDRLVAELIGPHAFDADAHLRSLGNRSAWGSSELVLTDFMFNPFGTGWHLDRAAFDARLVGAIADAGIGVWHDHEVTASRLERDWELTLATPNGPRTLRARVVCDASGRRATVARAQGVAAHRVDQLVAVGAVVSRTTADDDLTSTVQAVANGWWYTAPVPGARRAFVHFTDPDLLDRDVTRSWSSFTRAMHAADHVGAFAASSALASDSAGAPVVFAAGSRQLSAVVGNQWIAAGDAAATLDPLSSQGILTALLTGREAGTTLARMLGRDSTDARDARLEYAATWRRVVGDYEEERARSFAAEARFATHPFWARRRDRVPA